MSELVKAHWLLLLPLYESPVHVFPVFLTEYLSFLCMCKNPLRAVGFVTHVENSFLFYHLHFIEVFDIYFFKFYMKKNPRSLYASRLCLTLWPARWLSGWSTSCQGWWSEFSLQGPHGGGRGLIQVGLGPPGTHFGTCVPVHTHSHVHEK